MPTCGPTTLFFIFLLVLVSNVIHPSEANIALVANGSAATVEKKMVPLVVKEGEVRMGMVFNESRRKLGSFQICALCTCCGGARGVCLPSPCCYAINCNIPNRPFGFCSFTPKTCNCFGCHI